MTDNTHDAKRRITRNVIFSLVAWFLPLVVAFIATPILVKSLGTEQYGILALVLGFLSYSFTFGTGKIVAKFIPELLPRNQSEKLSEVISATLWFSLSIALIGSVTVALLAGYLVSNVLLIPFESREMAVASLYLASATGLVVMVGQTFQFVLQGLHRFGSYVLLTTLNGLMLGVGNIVLVLSGYGVASLLAWNLITAVFTGLLFFIRARRFMPEFTPTFRIDNSIWGSVLKYGGNIILFQVFANILYVFERTWVTRKFGPQGLTFYSVPMLLAVYMHGIVASFAQPLFPQINELLDNRDKLVSLYQKATKIVLAVVTFSSVAYTIAGKSFLSLWVNADLAENSYSLLVIHSLTFGLMAITIISLQVAEAFRFSRLMSIMTFTWMILSIPLMIFAADLWGSQGVAMSRLIAVVFTFPLILFVEKKFLGHVFWRFWLAAGSRLIVAAAATTFFGYHFFYRIQESWLTLVVGIIGCSILFAALLLISGYLSRNERDLIRSLVINSRPNVIADSSID